MVRKKMLKKTLILGVFLTILFQNLLSVGASDLNTEIYESIEKGVSYIYDKQFDQFGEEGEIAVYCNIANISVNDKIYMKINFGTSFAYHSLGFLEDMSLNSSTKLQLSHIRNNSIGFLKRKMELDEHDDPNVIGADVGGVVWRHYYGDDVPKNYKNLTRAWGVPDLDDTVCSLQALYESGENIDAYFPSSASDYFIDFQMRDSFLINKLFTWHCWGAWHSYALLKTILMKKLNVFDRSVPFNFLEHNSFNTWISEKNQVFHRVEDYDVVVNANALFFLSQQMNSADMQNKIPGVFDFINEGLLRVNNNRNTITFPQTWSAPFHYSGYYPSPFQFTFTVSRAYKDGGAPIFGEHSIDIDKVYAFLLADDDKDGMIDRQKDDGSWGNFEIVQGERALVTNDFETAQAALSLLNIYDTLNSSEKIEATFAINKSIEYLLENQNDDGSWDSGLWFWGNYIHSGSSEVTTAFVLETFAKYVNIFLVSI